MGSGTLRIIMVVVYLACFNPFQGLMGSGTNQDGLTSIGFWQRFNPFQGLMGSGTRFLWIEEAVTSKVSIPSRD